MDQRVFASTCEQQRGSKIERMNCVREREHKGGELVDKPVNMGLLGL